MPLTHAPQDAPAKAPDPGPRVVLPDLASLFAQRALRLRQLAPGHAMADFLSLMAALVGAQQAVAAARPAPPLDEQARTQSRDFGMPPLSAMGHARDPQWRDDLADLAAALDATGTAGVMTAALARLDTDAREALADRLLAGETLDSDAAAAPLVGAALQVYFTRRAAALDVADLQRLDVATVCPVCACRPMASVVRLGGSRHNLRYLACALCGTEWNLARIQCSACESERSVQYLALTSPGAAEGNDARSHAEAAQARRAEACDECHSYLKIFYQDKDPQLEPLADDLASLALDVALDERGYARSGPNLLFHPGSA